MTTPIATPREAALQAEVTRLRGELRHQALSHDVCLACHVHRIRPDALARLDGVVDEGR